MMHRSLMAVLSLSLIEMPSWSRRLIWMLLALESVFRAHGFTISPRSLSHTSRAAACLPLFSRRQPPGPSHGIRDRWVSGVSEETSGYVHHLRIRSDESPISVVSVVDRVLEERRRNRLDVSEISGRELLRLGSVWFLPASAPKDPSLGVKSKRLNSTDFNLQTDDYLRIHFQPRRFPVVHDYNWAAKQFGGQENGVTKPGVIVSSNDEKGWMVIDKPSGVPVHMTVDNCFENVAAQIRDARIAELTLSQGPGDNVYVATPQRLDQNTSGLLVVATSKPFAAYFANLLKNKTARQLQDHDEGDTLSSGSSGNIHKRYRCLVCLQSTNSDGTVWTAHEALEYLNSMKREGRVMRHFLESSLRAPKSFVANPPEDASKEEWAECLLKISKVSTMAPIVGSMAGQTLCEALWQDASGLARRVPPKVKAVVEVEVELLTGRTHQIRGQLSASGFPLVGDALYGGAVPMNPTDENLYNGTERLALQCCGLEFRDPDIREDLTMIPSNRWNKVSLKNAWWTTLLDSFRGQLQDETQQDVIDPVISSAARPEFLPDRVTLSPGKNKYVIIKATHPDDPEVQWFVKSASPGECGGPYHGNVAQEPRLWIEAANYTATVTGGGRIDYQPAWGTACVYGFSYGFGRGDHRFAADVINQHLDGVKATYDLSEDLY